MRFKQLFKKIYTTLFNFVFPPKCPSCFKLVDDLGLLCHSCWVKMDFISNPSCERCDNPFAYEFNEELCYYCKDDPPKFSRAVAVVKYDDFSDSLIHSFKYSDKIELAYPISQLMIKRLKASKLEYDILACVPIHNSKLKKRGYNQSAVLAKNISNKMNKKFIPNLLLKVKETDSQSGLTKEDRIKNVKGSFAINKKYKDQVFRKTVLLIDDVITTGATVNECCKNLRKAGAKKVVVLTFAKTCL